MSANTLIWRYWIVLLALVVTFLFSGASRAQKPAADYRIADVEKLFQSGKYHECRRIATEAIEQERFGESWRILKIRAELETGKYSEARTTLEAALETYKTGVRIRWLGHDVFRRTNDPDNAERMINEIAQLLQRGGWRYTDPESQLALAEYFLWLGADAKNVLEKIYDPVTARRPTHVGVRIASGQLALAKHDYALAADEFLAAVRLDATNPDAQLGLAKAYAPSDPAKADEALQAALANNTRHIESFLFIADEHIDSERYEQAAEALDKVIAINPHHAQAWAYRAVLAHLKNDIEREEECRVAGLTWWSANPEVDYLIGKKLSQKYRFAEGAEYQRRALAFDANYVPAKIQLAQDLLRLGREDEGWQLAAEVNRRDGYNIVAHNLVTLRDNLAGFRTIENDNFIVRMSPNEASIYGHRVLGVLEEAKKFLCAKYEVTIDEPVLVELFPKQQDFAIRTFGLPGGAGYLGVCFGNVITANSPASRRESPSNWEAVLWHEFCHVVTLQKTNNKMPRWLSEGISVYEELRRNPGWGQSMTPQYRTMILDGELTPLSQLSGAFLQPKSPVHLQFAYFESSLVVEHLVQQHGLDVLKRILVDLGVGMPINDALSRYCGSLEVVDAEFADFARIKAEELAPGLSFEQPELTPSSTLGEIASWLSDHPDNYYGLQFLAAKQIAEKDWVSARESLRKLIDAYPTAVDANSPYIKLAQVHRELGEIDKERDALEEIASLNGDAVSVFARLARIAESKGDWARVLLNVDRTLAADPLRVSAYRLLAKAAENTDNHARAIEAYRALLHMEPIELADLHFRLAQHLTHEGELQRARKHLLMSLEEAPRFRQAHRQLLEIVRRMSDNELSEKPELQ